MLFSSQIFFFYFLPVALLGYYIAPRSWRHLVLTAFSYLFYGWANPLFALIMFTTTALNYLFGLVIANDAVNVLSSLKTSHPLPALPAGDITAAALNVPRSRRQRFALISSVFVSLAALGFFKYFNFAIDTYNDALQLVGATSHQWHNLLRVTLPLGISFYTFQAMSYTIDVYRGQARAITRFIDFACYVSMFPQLVAGPIIRFQEIERQLRERVLTLTKFSRGVAFVSFGLAKKILLANSCGKIADTCFNAASLDTVDAWFGAIAYAFQIYFDFSAYSDMAIGLGLMLGFVFPKNFDSPYLSKSITEFWHRWHISLSTWLRDYLYFSLGGNRKSNTRTYVNLAMVMLLGGLWHGASWNFVIWGGIHGGVLIFERLQGKESAYRTLPNWLRTFITFIIVTLAWVFFRAPDIHSAVTYIGSMFGQGTPGAASYLISGILYSPYAVLALVSAAAITWTAPQTWELTRKIGPGKATLCIGLLAISLIVMSTQSFNPFIYFIF
ncbi:MAG: MBOAT family protein [Deltaproteobacteria bacterium]|nr:MBOAT family protein [Deltaproteobacteria bacterium]MBN2671114.1 MBOAT family protein [Deltaproteobacteria bacterium]